MARLMLTQASPTPILGLCNEAGPQRIPFHIATDGEEMVIRLDRERLETTLVEVAGAGRVMMKARKRDIPKSRR
jgi:hypothetical protein